MSTWRQDRRPGPEQHGHELGGIDGAAGSGTHPTLVFATVKTLWTDPIDLLYLANRLRVKSTHIIKQNMFLLGI